MEQNEKRLKSLFPQVKTVDVKAARAAQRRLDSLIKPTGSLGRLEEMAVQVCGITGELYPEIHRRSLLIMAADNGVVAQGVAGAPQSVTLSQTKNLALGVAGAAVLARQFSADLVVVDVGVDTDEVMQGVLDRKIRRSTGDISQEAAMTREQACAAILVGVETAHEAYEQGSRLLGAGEMGIGNTTTAAAVLCGLTGLAPRQTVGFGAGLTQEGYQNKISVVEKALAFHKAHSNDPLEVLSKLGGLDIAAMAGIYLGGAITGCPVVVDGFISAVAALVACRLEPAIRLFLLASHRSAEPGFRWVIEEMGLEPPLDLGMRLGEGSGCPLLFALLDGAFAAMREMASFQEAGMDEEYQKPLAFAAKE
ncbi:nicotinate-nucleotide--dimethylbenzimidazole phosphoribosyltransferase [Oscillospiraceae bacterium MB08-C2-2]|nr:nicotinate-nucleotide--dimethylbenzimidazole phosphoribosyltransferase [Oscillospiraceae bacterium MB08-C2-2]